MGCTASNLGSGEQEAAAHGAMPIWRRIDEIGRRRNVRMRKDSIVSTTELLGPDGGAADFDEGSPDPSAVPPVLESDDSIASSKAEVPVHGEKKEEREEKKPKHVAVAVMVVRGEEEELKKEEEEKSGEERKGGEEEELLGSPSFRFYVPHDSDNDDSVKPPWLKNKEDKTEEAEGKEDSHGKGASQENLHEMKDSMESLTSSEDSELKSPKKKKGRRLRGLTKAPSRVSKLLGIQNCYS